MNVARHFWYTIIHVLLYMFLFTTFYLLLRVGWLLVLSLLLHGCCCQLEGLVPTNWYNTISWMDVVTPTYRPKSARNCCVIEVFGGVLCCQLVVEFSVGTGTLVIGLSQIFSFSHWIQIFQKIFPERITVVFLKTGSFEWWKYKNVFLFKNHIFGTKMQNNHNYMFW